MTNILLVSFDDLNDWSSVLGGYGGTVYTPNLDRLAAAGTTFSNAFCATPTCNGSRTSALSGQALLRTGVLTNQDPWYERVDPEATLPGLLKAEGYTTLTAGKVFHKLPTNVATQLYDQVLVEQGASEAGEKLPGQIIPTGTLNNTGIYTGDPNDLSDVKAANAVADYLANYQPRADAPGLFLSIGINRPHTPLIVPQEYFDLYPIEDIVLPEVLPDDLNDIPGFGQFFSNTKDFDRLRLAGEWPSFVQAYLASVSFADAMLGRMLDALAASAIADDTLVAVWSDHGYHLGEKEHVGKFTLWEEAARSTLIIAPPASATAGQTVNTPVSLLDLTPTLLDYAGLPPPPLADGESLREAIDTGDTAGLRGDAVTSIVGSHSIRTLAWRYSRYEDGSEELYNLRDDPNEFVNLAADPAFARRVASLAAQLDERLDEVPFLQNRSDRAALLDGRGGERVLIANTADDTLIGGDGDNVFIVPEAGVKIRERPASGLDTVYARSSFTLPDHVENLDFRARTGLGGEVVLRGNEAANRLQIITGRATLDRAGGDDTLAGNNGADRLGGGAGDDRLESARGEDTLDGGGGNDRLLGADGDDLYVLSAGLDEIGEQDARFGFDRIDVAAWGGLGSVLITRELDASGATVVLRLEQLGGTAVTTVDARKGRVVVEALVDGSTTLLLSRNRLEGTDRAETLLGSTGADTLQALDGNDSVAGRAGDDVIDGGDGDDTLHGDTGANTLIGGNGDDRLFGGPGLRDVASYATATGGVTVSLSLQRGLAQATGSAGNDVLLGMEHLAGSRFADALFGNAVANRIEGGAGNDDLRGREGDDTLAGGAGNDVLLGGIGRDRFVFTARDAGGTDTISDFAPGDRIDLSALDADPATVARDPLRLGDEVTLATGAGGVRITVIVETVTFAIELSGAAAPTTGDFLL